MMSTPMLRAVPLNTKDVKKAMEMVKGTARSMGVDIIG